MTPFNALGLLNNSNPAVSQKKKLNSTNTKDNNNFNHTVRFQDLTKMKLVPYIVCTISTAGRVVAWGRAPLVVGVVAVDPVVGVAES